MAVILLAVVTAGFIVTRGVLRPILRLKSAAQALAAGAWQPVSAVGRVAEVDALTHSFNDMAAQLKQMLESLTAEIAERKRAEAALRESNRRLEKALAELQEMQERMMQQERLAAVGQLAAGIAHDFNNILATITLYTQLSLRANVLTPELRQRLETIAQQAQHAADLVQQILDFGRQAMMERRPLAMDSFLQGVVQMLNRTLPESIQLSLAFEPGDYGVNADPARLQQAIVNLALNARDAMPKGGTLTLTLARIEDQEIDCVDCGRVVGGAWVQVRITDSGMGIPPEVLPHLFEPFFTTRAPLGHGLGLAQVYGIVKQHEGHLAVETAAGHGTTFVLYLPALPVSVPVADTPASIAPVPSGQGQTILVVEDDAAVRAALVEVLELLGYQVLAAAEGHEALELCARRPEIALALCDWVMPSMGGQDFVHALQERQRAVKVLVLTGHPLDNEVTQSATSMGIVGWVLKPADLEQLAEAIAQALEI